MSRLDRLNRSTAILPATMELFGKRKITIPECASVWDSGTVLVCRNEENRICFVYGSGTGYGYNIGDNMLCHHDQTGTSKGNYEIVNIVTYTKVGNGVVLDSVITYNRNTKASLAVFK